MVWHLAAAAAGVTGPGQDDPTRRILPEVPAANVIADIVVKKM